ncbi:MAG: hypothetical protein JSS49_00295 [Planctomycetes bacterium]|nr:hypothetical protein [Planctomycetota bacterium]
MAKTTRTPPPISQETREHLLTLIRSTTEPVTAAQVAKLLTGPHKLSEARVAPILDEFVAQARLKPIPPKTAKGKPRFWDRDSVELGRLLITATLEKKGAVSQSELRKGAKSVSDADFLAAFQSLIESQKLFEHPPLPKKKSSAFGIQPPSPELYLRDLGIQLSQTVAQLVAAKVPAEQLRRALVQLVEATGVSFNANVSRAPAAPPEPCVTDLVALIRRIEPGADNGALVASRDLRRAANLEKTQFDRAVLELASQGRLMLHRHDFASGLSEIERNELVTDGAGTYYVGMALRRGVTG